MKKFIKSNLGSLIIIMLFATYLVFFGTAVVNGSSMYPTYNNEDFLLLRKTDNVKTGDIVAIYSHDLGKILCKRVIGVAGDSVEINNEGVYVNNELLDEDYITIDWTKNYLSVTVPENSLFVLGDNRNNSTDSRILGCLSCDDLIGISIFNVTKATSLTRTNLLHIVIFLWICLCIIFIFDKKRKQKNEG